MKTQLISQKSLYHSPFGGGTEMFSQFFESYLKWSSKYENLWKKVAVYLTIIKIQKLKLLHNKRAVNINLFF